MRKGSGGRTPRGEGRAHPESTGAVEKGSLLLMGQIFRAHGVRGEVKVWPETDDPGRFRELSTVFLGADPEHARPQAVESVRFQQTRRGTMVVLKLKGIETREAAEALRKTDVFALREDLPPLAEGEFFFDDLIGLDASFRAINIARARSRGAELSFDASLRGDVEIRSSYSWTDAEDRATGAALPRRPRQRLALTVLLPERGRWDGSLTFLAVADRISSVLMAVLTWAMWTRLPVYSARAISR